ncbi:MAG: hypothetical protein V7703_11525 [Hyphomicrobiales bacterium]
MQQTTVWQLRVTDLLAFLFSWVVKTLLAGGMNMSWLAFTPASVTGAAAWVAQSAGASITFNQDHPRVHWLFIQHHRHPAGFRGDACTREPSLQDQATVN